MFHPTHTSPQWPGVGTHTLCASNVTVSSSCNLAQNAISAELPLLFTVPFLVWEYTKPERNCKVPARKLSFASRSFYYYSTKSSRPDNCPKKNKRRTIAINCKTYSMRDLLWSPSSWTGCCKGLALVVYFLKLVGNVFFRKSWVLLSLLELESSTLSREVKHWLPKLAFLKIAFCANLQKILDLSAMLVKCTLKGPVRLMCDDFLDLADTSLHFFSRVSWLRTDVEKKN